MEQGTDANRDRMEREDSLHVGATRPVRFLGLPMPLAVALIGVAYMVQTNVTGWRGLLWAAGIVAPLWIVAWIAVAHDPYGVNVGFAWLRTCAISTDRGIWGGASCSPLPGRSAARARGM
jgi:type IV secretion system protein VirB3